MQLNLKLTAAVYAAIALAYFEITPWWTVSVTVLLIFSRWAFDIHTRTHSPKDYPFLEELMLLIMGPFTVGLNEQRILHMSHHGKKTFWTEADCDYLYYSAHPLVALVLCFFHPEISFLRMYLTHMGFAAIGRAFIRLVIFTVLVFLLGNNYLWYLLPLRLVFGVSQFVFTWVLHHRPEQHTINLPISNCWILPLGKVAVRELNTHIMHHAH